MGLGKGVGHLRREISTFGVSFIVLNGLIGAGIFALPATLFSQAGAFSPWLFPIIGLLFITIILSFSELASYFSESGGPVLYNYTAFGPLAGFQTGWFLYLGRLTAMAANANVLIYYAAFLVPDLADGWVRGVTLFSVFALLAIGNILGVKQAMKALAVLSTFKLVPLFVLILVGVPHVVPSEVVPVDFPQIDNFGATALLLMYAFMGFESALMTAGETNNPRRNVPRGLIITVLSITLFYFLVQLVYSAAAPQLPTSNGAPLVELGSHLLGAYGAVVITLAAIFSVGGNLMSNMVAVPRMTFAMAEENTLPKWFGVLHKDYDTPVNSIVFYAVLCFALAVSGSFVWLAVVSSLSRLFVFVSCLASIPVLRKKLPADVVKQALRMPGGYTIPAIAAVFCVWAASYSTADAWLTLGALASVGMVFYWFSHKSKD
ncbi:MAG: amino acid permease [Sphingomonadales bacterium]|nr:amino acid permease [Sphingomonadales bacterium]